MRRKLTLILGFIALSIISNAQSGFGKPKEIEELYKRKVIIVKEVYNEKTIKKLEKKGKKGDVTLYKNRIIQYNADLQEAVKSMWPKETTFVVKSFEDVVKMRKDKKYNYAVVRTVNIQSTTTTTYSSTSKSHTLDEDEGLYFNYTPILKGTYNSENRNSPGGGWNYIYISLIEDIYKKPIILVGMPSSFPSKADLSFSVQYANWYMQERLNDKNVKMLDTDVAAENTLILTDKTLYIRESDLTENCTEVDINENYKYKYSIVNDSVFDHAAMSKGEDIIYLIKLPFPTISANMQFQTVAMDASSGYPCSIVMMSTLIMMPGTSKNTMTPFVFKQISKDIAKAQETK